MGKMTPTLDVQSLHQALGSRVPGAFVNSDGLIRSIFRAVYLPEKRVKAGGDSAHPFIKAHPLTLSAHIFKLIGF